MDDPPDGTVLLRIPQEGGDGRGIADIDGAVVTRLPAAAIRFEIEWISRPAITAR